MHFYEEGNYLKTSTSNIQSLLPRSQENQHEDTITPSLPLRVPFSPITQRAKAIKGMLLYRKNDSMREQFDRIAACSYYRKETGSAIISSIFA
jgi:hypothetical protein